MAEGEERAAAEHAAQYSADASEGADRCLAGSAGPTTAIGATCWTSTRNPTAAHLDEARRLKRMAADHRAASQVLRDAEARACAGLSDEDRDVSPFAHRQDIAGAEPLEEALPRGRTTRTQMAGAIVAFHAVPGMTTPWLQRVVDCHLARNAALGHDVPEMPWCPLVPNGVTARASATAVGFAVSVRSDDPRTAAEILRRARSLMDR